ncbi:FkbM family methyltransferase [Pseudomonas sp. NPDC077649]|uniref:FkbM family methyltransferase n=1 Tax=Pseudomonas sp. NPDC077649 TaxID=3364423 RepID=UPI0037CA4202
MAFISYAQNFEDVTLWRALRLFGPGHYIDVGANHPTHDSVTRAFYERGWRGVNIEPVEHYHEALCAERPGDVNLCVAVGPAAGELTFYENCDSGLSTPSEAMREMQESAGIQFVPRTVRAMRLDAICQDYLPTDKPFHFLKIDVEGFELQVLQSMDFSRWRPWIVVLECPFDKQPDWEELMIAAGYQHAYGDGINRYWVASERDHLLPAFSLPPNILDEFKLCPGHVLASEGPEVQALRDALMQAQQQLQTLQGSRSWRLIRRLARLKATLGGFL